ncbi:hypothetical protein [Bacillus atrophaeus]|uniref:hypothetical protein n=1 Tax=Bacillus atrophaeus TaxID=1452 RepID=UPI00227E7D0B|nr:hypothetical protein [Bacillus atrophaeus]MCY8916272.1 hypothetical protein [Bacillus atrophaeus]MCY8926430.1 hypothetical protein [Bacillus atrophaeus]MED4846204.1 hypothetical protein [Bacillus atrophaeus]
MGSIKGLEHYTFGTPDKCTKPPIGVIPKQLHDLYRVTELKNAIKRYIDAGCGIPTEWVEEYNLLLRSSKSGGGIG